MIEEARKEFESQISSSPLENFANYPNIFRKEDRDEKDFEEHLPELGLKPGLSLDSKISSISPNCSFGLGDNPEGSSMLKLGIMIGKLSTENATILQENVSLAQTV